jgi:protein SCO1/2
VAIGASAVIVGSRADPRLTGTGLGNTAAPDFTLQDAAGNSFSLQDFRGKTVVLTFLYANCPDICPAIAGKLHDAAQQLRGTASRVEFIAVSVDPEGDTPQSVSRFTSDHGLDALGGRWRYGIGFRDQLAAVWHAYGIGAEPQPAALSALRPDPSRPAVIDHNAVLYLIDPQGWERVLLEADVTTDALVHDVKQITGS